MTSSLENQFPDLLLDDFPPTTSQGGKRPPDPGFPWTSQAAMDDEVLARQASFSRTWHHAVVTATRTSGRHTACDIRWGDGSHTRALPLSRVRRLSSDAPLHAVDPPQPGHQSSSTTPLCATAPAGAQPQRSSPSEPTGDLPLGAQGRSASPYNAAVPKGPTFSFLNYWSALASRAI